MDVIPIAIPIAKPISVAAVSNPSRIFPPVKFFAIGRGAWARGYTAIFRRLIFTDQPPEILARYLPGFELHQRKIGALRIFLLEICEQSLLRIVQANRSHGRAIASQNLAAFNEKLEIQKKNENMSAQKIRRIPCPSNFRTIKNRRVAY